MHGRRCVITVRSFGAQPIETSLLGLAKVDKAFYKVLHECPGLMSNQKCRGDLLL